jgi:antirestriction protein ArdC
MTNQTIDNYAEVTNRIISALENNTRPWVKPWDDGVLSLPLRYNGESYKGINSLILWSEASEKNYNQLHWMTFKQAKALGGQIRKGEKSTSIFYSGTIKAEEQEEQGSKDGEEKFKRFMKSYRVFNAQQIDHLPEKYYIKTEKSTEEVAVEKLPKIESFILNTKAKINHGGISAYYRQTEDFIQMPFVELFKTNNSYYTTLCHELTHWTKHQTRLDRNLGGKRYGDQGYAMEELVAELGAVFVSVALGIAPDVREDHAPYIASWLKVLKADKKAIFNAASLAQNAANYLLALNNTE